MINKLKWRFTLLASISILILLTVLLSIVNIANYVSVISECDKIIDALVIKNQPHLFWPNNHDKPFTPHGMSSEVMYESRFFTVSIDENQNIKNVDMSNIISVDENSVSEYAQKAINKGKMYGMIGNFRYKMFMYEDNSKFIVFLDCGRKLDSFWSFLWMSVVAGLGICVLVFLIFVLISSRIVKPISDSYEKQKRFITDASHEIKTPLTIISANVDLLEDDFGTNECLDDIKEQTKKLTKLTNSLVYLSKMEESTNKLSKIEFPISDLVSETADSFKAVATSKNIEYLVNIEPNVTFFGLPEAISQLTSILIENAMKYSPDGSNVNVSLVSQKKNVHIKVSNTTLEPIDKDKCSKLFERFYRVDDSHNSKTGGHGIGLSVAKAIVDAHEGKISANAIDNIFEINVIL
ncbi:MAG: HAMP domain-containing histidine kinase [Clostridia bacterium]|nr:HAMP domain-containing histidine kinase [Clostridia bacterium]